MNALAILHLKSMIPNPSARPGWTVPRPFAIDFRCYVEKLRAATVRLGASVVRFEVGGKTPPALVSTPKTDRAQYSNIADQFPAASDRLAQKLKPSLRCRVLLDLRRREIFTQANCLTLPIAPGMMPGERVSIMGYDWTGTRTRRIRHIKLAVSAIISIAALAIPVFAAKLP